MDLNGRVAIVTGAARGLGRHLAEALGRAGAKVGLADVLAAELNKGAAEMGAAGLEVLPVAADTTDAGQVEAMVGRVSDELGPVDVLVNNAGTFSVVGPVWEVDPDRWFRDVRVNLYGSFLCCRAVLKQMVARETGTVINIVSGGGVGDPHPYSTSYATSKTGLMRLTEGIAREAEPFNVKVFAVGPPAIRTAMTEFLMLDAGARKWRPTFSKIFDENKDADPSIVSDLILKLLSGRADRLSGRFFSPRSDFEALLADEERILEEDLWTLRIKGRDR